MAIVLVIGLQETLLTWPFCTNRRRQRFWLLVPYPIRANFASLANLAVQSSDRLPSGTLVVVVPPGWPIGIDGLSSKQLTDHLSHCTNT